MKHTIVTCLACAVLMLTGSGHGQTERVSRIEREYAGVLGSLSPDLISKIRQLALLLQQEMADGRINEATIQRELQGGDVAGAIRELGPDATRLLDEIKSAFQSTYSEESLALLLQLLMSSRPTQ